MANTDIRVVLIGKTGNGKSATGNSLLDNPYAFEVKSSASSVTRVTASRTRAQLTGSKTITVIDTPGLFDTNSEEDHVITEIVKCIGLSSPGPHAFLYVLKVGAKLTNEESEALSKFVAFFGERLFDFLIIVFTHKKDLGSTDIWEYAQNVPPQFKSLWELCKNRIIAIENSNIEDRRKTIKHLLKMIEDISGTSHLFYTNEMFKLTEDSFAKRLKELGKDAKRSDVTNEVETGGQALTYLLVGAVGGSVATILSGTMLVGGTFSAAFSATAAATLGSQGSVAAAATTSVATGGATGMASAGATVLAAGGASPAAAVVAAGSSCVIT